MYFRPVEGIYLFRSMPDDIPDRILPWAPLHLKCRTEMLEVISEIQNSDMFGYSDYILN